MLVFTLKKWYIRGATHKGFNRILTRFKPTTKKRINWLKSHLEIVSRRKDEIDGLLNFILMKQRLFPKER